MITLADVGIGIRGLEGSEAARNSDFAIGEFRNLKPLMYIHGRENYRRNSVLLLYIIWRNMYITLTSLFWGFYNGFSGQPLFHELLISYFQVLYTSIGISIYSLTDREYDDKTLLSRPEAYEIGMKNKYFNKKVFWWFELNGGIQGMWPFIFMCLLLEQSAAHSDGTMTVFWTVANMTFWVSCFAMNIILFIYASKITIILTVGVVLGIDLSWIWMDWGLQV